MQMMIMMHFSHVGYVHKVGIIFRNMTVFSFFGRNRLGKPLHARNLVPPSYLISDTLSKRRRITRRPFLFLISSFSA